MSARGLASHERVVMVRVGELEVAGPGATLASVGIGSCVAIALYDATSRVGGLAHVLLPDPALARSPGAAGRFASTAVDALLRMMDDAGAARAHIHARIAGGAAMFPALLSAGGRPLGARNIEAAQAALQNAQIPLHGQDVGGEHGRSVFLRVSDGRLLVRSVRFDDVAL